MDFSDWKTFTMTSGDKTVQNTYRIKVVSKAQAEITSFRVQAVGEWYNGVIDNAKSTITVTDVDDSKLTSTKLVTDIEFTGRSCSPTSGIAVDFANAATSRLVATMIWQAAPTPYCAEQERSADLCKEQRRR